MKTLYLMRHAKSSWDDTTLSDFERPLNARGLKAAPFMGTLMKERRLVPDLILCSPATRAKDTAKQVRAAADLENDIKYDKRIYDATVGTLLEVIAEIDELLNSALVIGHNPGTEGLIYYLTGEIAVMPTAALAVIELDLKIWSDVCGNCGTLQSTFRPKDEM